MAKTTVFISFDYDNDAYYKNLLLAWDNNEYFDFNLYDGSLKDAIDSANAPYIKSKIRPKILAAERLLCIVGEKTSKSKWIDWEIQIATDNSKKLIGVKTAKDNISPVGLIGAGAAWALSFNFNAIKNALDES